eukprot:CAMPEP_0184656830 /NCGR_PEP_ID=MMETSP0308-20130426/16787_1 /TAXON_ID=38269 /ORGANISM="Gloeochaete witrockiana, Strain SAG 46.84" /LENGTH=287 /DNA_ID=CAMNT_0027094129 /DNA_START=108 /DNA_END=968 /DNA_ORIENTATION=+
MLIEAILDLCIAHSADIVKTLSTYAPPPADNKYHRQLVRRVVTSACTDGACYLNRTTPASVKAVKSLFESILKRHSNVAEKTLSCGDTLLSILDLILEAKVIRPVESVVCAIDSAVVRPVENAVCLVRKSAKSLQHTFRQKVERTALVWRGEDGPIGLEGALPTIPPTLSPVYIDGSSNSDDEDEIVPSSFGVSVHGADDVWYFATTTTTMGPGGVSETQQSIVDTISGIHCLRVTRTLGDRSLTLIRQRDVEGHEMLSDALQNIRIEQASDFDAEWRLAANSLPAW